MHHGAPVERGPGAGAEHLAGLVEAAVVALEAPALLAGAVAAQHVARVVEQRRVARSTILQATDAAAGVGPERRDHALEPVRPSTTSVFTSATSSLPAASTPRLAAKAKPVLRPRLPRARAGLSRSSSSDPSVEPLSTTIVLRRRERLRGDRLEAPGQPAPPVPVRDDDGDARRHYSVGPAVGVCRSPGSALQHRGVPVARTRVEAGAPVVARGSGGARGTT